MRVGFALLAFFFGGSLGLEVLYVLLYFTRRTEEKVDRWVSSNVRYSCTNIGKIIVILYNWIKKLRLVLVFVLIIEILPWRQNQTRKYT